MDVVRLVLFMNCAILAYCQSCTSGINESEWQNEYFEEMRNEIKSIRQLFRAQQKATICSDKQVLQKMKSELQCIRQNLSHQKQALESLREKCHETVIVQNGRTSKSRPTPSPTSTSAKDRCPHMADIAFLVDSSSSLSDLDFEQVKLFMTDVILDLPVDGGNKVRVSVTSYASAPQTYFALDRYSTSDDILHDIAVMMQQRGGRNLADGVHTLQRQVFVADKGDRPWALNVVVIVTRTSLDENTRTVAQALTQLEDTHVMIVGVGDDDGRELWDLVTQPRSSHLFLARSFEDTTAWKKQILAQICEVCDSNIPRLKATTRPLTTALKVRTTTTATTVKPTTQGTTPTTQVIVQNGWTSKSRSTPSPTSMSAKDRCRLMADIAFLVDSSSSLSDLDFNQVKLFMTDVILDLPVDGGNKARVSVTSYASAPQIYFALDRYSTSEDILHDIAVMMQQRGGRNLTEGVRALQRQVFVADKGDRPWALNVVVIVTRTSLDENTRTVAQALTQLEDTHVMMVGVGDDDGRELWDLVTPPRSSNLFLARSFDETTALKKQILAQICEVCDSNIPSLKATTRPLTTTVKVRTTTTATTVRPTTQRTTPTTQRTTPTTRRTTPTTRRETSPGFLPTTTIGPRTSTTHKYGEACNKTLDLVFAFDSSGGLQRPQFTRNLDFAKRFVGQMNIGADDTRIGAISFSNNIRTNLHLKDTSTVDDVKNKLGKVPYRPGKRELKQGMNAIRDTMFLEQNGNRASVPNVAIIFTDGFSGEEAATYDEESLSIAERGIELFQIVWQQKGRDVVHTGERVFAVNSLETLNGILEDVKQVVCDVGQS